MHKKLSLVHTGSFVTILYNLMAFCVEQIRR